jgi:hypothetical protein
MLQPMTLKDFFSASLDKIDFQQVAASISIYLSLPPAARVLPGKIFSERMHSLLAGGQARAVRIVLGLIRAALWL